MKRIIINGANGYLASNFINELLIRDYDVIALVRGNNKLSSKQRMINVLREMSNGKNLKLENMKICDYSLLNKDFLMSQKQLEDIFSIKVDYYHFAASLKYSEKTKNEIFETNLNGLENSINVFLKYASPDSRFFFISTAYSCGKMTELFEEKFYDNEGILSFRNYYELSKRLAENIVKKYIDSNGLNAHVIRPSQVVGNNKTGKTKTDFGIFDFSKRICNLAYRYSDETVRIKVDLNSTQNLIPIDTVVYYLMQTVATDKLPVIMNFVAKQAVKNGIIIKCLCDILPINIISNKHLDKDSMTPIERLIEIAMFFTGDYCDTNIQFGTSNLDKIIKINGSEINNKSLQLMLYYFIDSYLTEKQTYKLSLQDK